MMKPWSVILIVTLSSAASSSDKEFDYLNMAIEDPISVNDFHYKQKLDHFNPTDDQKWSQKYAVTADFYRRTGPAFLFIHGASPVYRGYEFPNSMLSYARNLSAICFSLEHRFYSKTSPVNGSIVNHLSTAQALEDIANFIKGMNVEFHLPSNTNWIVFGCSYGGMLAAWARRKYTHLIHGAVVSSSPLLLKLDYYEYEQTVEESLKSYDSKCVESITSAFEGIAHLLNSTQNMKNIVKMFYLGDDPSYDLAVIKTNISYVMLNIIKKAVQSNDVRAYPISIPILCRIMIEYNGTKLEALARIRKMVIEHKQGDLKIQSEKYLEGQKSMKNEYSEAPTKGIEEAWKYQRCSEFGYFSSFTNTTFLSAVKHYLRPIEVEIVNLCQSFFGPNFSAKNLTEKIEHTNSQHGGLDFNVCNTIFIHGSLDPWHKAGLFKKSNASLYETVFINGTSHCADIHPPTDKDTPELKNAHNTVFKTLKSWLKKESTSISSRNLKVV